MPTLEAPSPVKLQPAIDLALGRIPPLWPLRHFVAVNPYSGLAGMPFAEAAILLQRTQGTLPLQSPAEYLAAYADGRITQEDLQAVADEKWQPESLLTLLESGANHAPYDAAKILTVADLLDQDRPHAHWAVFVTEEISKWCAVHYDENQTTWNSPWRNLGLYAAWREAALLDANPEAGGITGFRNYVRTLPESAPEAIMHLIRHLAPEHTDCADLVTRELLSISGWAGYVQYRVREDGMRGHKNPALLELLAIRLAFDGALLKAHDHDGSVSRAWRSQCSLELNGDWAEGLSRWQLAYEHGYQQFLTRTLTASTIPQEPERPAIQAVFCIDVRSEVLRRHLEAAMPAAQTVGFAGFFGFPISHENPATSRAEARCPVLLVPPVETSEDLSERAAAQRMAQRDAAGAWKAFQNSAASCFSFVEAIGTAFSAPLATLRGSSRPVCTGARPKLVHGDLPTRVKLAAGALRNMSLTGNFARLVMICGHGSRSANNPYASSLDCGACGGHAGDVNARLAADTLNDSMVRQELKKQGISIPADTWFIAGVHNTTTDEVTLLDAAAVPASHQLDLADLEAALRQAGNHARSERAASLGLRGAAGVETDTRRRTHDMSEVRPEWGLANNAALIVAPRWRTSGVNLQGRTFLHDYDHRQDVNDDVLTLILCAPVVVASWINLQYYASRVDPAQYGSGNKVLHNVTAGLGVMEGNSGDLRVGLPWQSIHNGERFMHEPRRLTVYLEAPRERIMGVLDNHPEVRQLFDNTWIHLVALESAAAFRYSPTGWKPMPSAGI
jgi:uncharacterized protein